MANTHDIIQPLHPETVEVTPVANEAEGLATILRERWRCFILFAGIIAVLSLGAIAIIVEPEYEVRALVHVAPIVRPIISRDLDTDISRNYSGYLTTQRGILTSTALINETVNDPSIKSCEWLANSEDPVQSVLKSLNVFHARNTEHLRVSLTGKYPRDLANVVNHLVMVYIDLHEDEKKQEDERALSSLRREEAELENRLKLKSEELRQLADSGLIDSTEGSSAEWLGMPDYRTMLTTAKQDNAFAKAQLASVRKAIEDKGIEQLSLPGLEEFTGQDLELLELKKQLRTIQLSAHTDVAMGRGASHPEVRSRPHMVKALNKSIVKRKDVLRDEFIARMLRDLEATIEEADITETIVTNALSSATAERVGAVRQAFLVDDIKHERAQIEKSLFQVRNQIWTVEVEQNRMPRVSLRSRAIPPPKPNIDKRFKYAAVALLFSFSCGAGIALVRSRMDTLVRRPSHVTQQLGVPLLGTIHQVRKKSISTAALDEAMTEPTRSLSTALTANCKKDCPRKLLITSPTSGSGKSSMAWNLARSFAASGRRVLVVDSDNDRQGLTRRLDLFGKVGLQETLANKIPVDNAILKNYTSKLDVLPAGERSQEFGALLMNRDAQNLLSMVFDKYDDIVIDSPPVLANSHAVILAVLADETILVIKSGQCDQAEARAAYKYLNTVGANVVGAVLNGVDATKHVYGYGYGYGAEISPEST